MLDISFAREDVSEAVDPGQSADLARLPICKIVELAAARDAGDGLGDGADRAEDDGRADGNDLARDGAELSIFDAVPLKAEAAEGAVLVDRLDRAEQFLKTHKIFLHHARHDLYARFLGAGERLGRVVARRRERHIFHAAPVDEDRALHPYRGRA